MNVAGATRPGVVPGFRDFPRAPGQGDSGQVEGLKPIELQCTSQTGPGQWGPVGASGDQWAWEGFAGACRVAVGRGRHQRGEPGSPTPAGPWVPSRS